MAEPEPMYNLPRALKSNHRLSCEDFTVTLIDSPSAYRELPELLAIRFEFGFLEGGDFGHTFVARFDHPDGRLYLGAWTLNGSELLPSQLIRDKGANWRAVRAPEDASFVLVRTEFPMVVPDADIAKAFETATTKWQLTLQQGLEFPPLG